MASAKRPAKKRPASLKNRSGSATIRVGNKKSASRSYKGWKLGLFIIIFGAIGTILLILTHADTNNCATTTSSVGSTMQICANLNTNNTVNAKASYTGALGKYQLKSGTATLYQCDSSGLQCTSIATSQKVAHPNLFKPNLATITTANVAYTSGSFYKACVDFLDNTGWQQAGECTSLQSFGATVTQTDKPKVAAPCGGEVPTAKSDGSAWTCTFDDEFNGTALDTTKWTAWDNQNFWSVHNVCYYADSQHVSEQGGSLNLTVTKLTNPPSCNDYDGSNPTPIYGAAVVHTQNKFSQTYGRFEARIKFAGGWGIHDDFWLWPQKNNYPPGHAEIDIAEPFSVFGPDQMPSAVHFEDSTGKNADHYKACSLPSWSSNFHTFTLEWTSTHLIFSYDGVQCFDYSGWDPAAGYTPPAPFNQDFFAILQSTVDDGGPNSTTVFPVTTQVDYLRVWK